MDQSGWWSSYLAGTLVVLVPALLLVGVFTWLTRDQGIQTRPVEVVVGCSAGLAVSLVVTFVGEPRSAFGRAVCSMLIVVVASAIMLPWSYFRSRRWRRLDAAGRLAARAAIHSAARVYFAGDDFQRELAGITEVRPPSPDTASDVIAYWVFRALDCGDHVEWSRLIHYATAMKGWRLSTPTLAGTVPWLVAPFLVSGEKRWDPAVDRDFRRYGVATLTARFGTEAVV